MLCRDMTLDLKKAIDPVPWAKSELSFNPDPWQAEVLRSQAPRMLLNCSRQSGKSITTAIVALHTAIFSPGSLILLLSPTLRQSGELFRNVLRFYGQLQSSVSLEAESALRLELANGSRIVSLPGQEQTIRGYAGVSLLVVDEAARVLDDLYYSVRPMLAVSRGRLVALSTPWGKRGWFFKAWSSSEVWERWEVPASKCPRISPEFLEEERRTLGEWWFWQEYMCQFMETEDQIFSHDLIEKMLDPQVQPLFEASTMKNVEKPKLMDVDIKPLDLEEGI